MDSLGSPSFIKLVPFAIAPREVAAFPKIVSKSCAMVIRLGIACGFIIISGTTPSMVLGISHP